MRYKGLEFQDYQRNLPWDEELKLYPFGNKEAGCFEFGYEAEFSAAELVPLFAMYSPASAFGSVPWKSFRVAEKVGWVRDTLSKMSYGNKSAVLEKVGSDDGLPTFLHRDDTGNLELTTAVYSTLAELNRQIKNIESYAVGSMQAMISLPKVSFFGFAKDPKSSALAHLGWLNFFNELDILERLAKGAVRFKQKPQIDPVRSFLHPYLGPMISLRHQILKNALENSLENKPAEEDFLRPGRTDPSYKFIGSTAYRPDLGSEDRICFEVRDAHKDSDLLRNRIARILFYWQRDLQVFSQFSQLPSFDSGSVYLDIPEELRLWLEKVTPLRIPADLMDLEKPKFVYEVYRNFSYPLRDWRPWLVALGAEDQLKQVSIAQAEYIKKLEINARRSSAGTREAQGALAEFALESGLFNVFRVAEESFVRRLHG